MKMSTGYSALTLLFLLLCTELSTAQCPSYGDAPASDPAGRALNKRKNRSARAPEGLKIQSLPLNLLINSRKKNDAHLYMDGAYVFTEGYITATPEEKGPESCNCGQASVKKKNGDLHIYLGLTPGAPKKKCIVVEITPAYKKLHPNYIDGLVKGQKVRVEGRLLFDLEHTGDAVNTCQTCAFVWRKSCWEIHPVTKIKVIDN